MLLFKRNTVRLLSCGLCVSFLGGGCSVYVARPAKTSVEEFYIGESKRKKLIMLAMEEGDAEAASALGLHYSYIVDGEEKMRLWFTVAEQLGSKTAGSFIKELDARKSRRKLKEGARK